MTCTCGHERCTFEYPTHQPKIHKGGSVACPECGGYTFYMSKILYPDAEHDQNHYTLLCGNPNCLWGGELL